MIIKAYYLVHIKYNTKSVFCQPGKPSVGITGNLIAGEESRQLQLRCDVLYAVPADLSRTADADRFPNLTARIGDVELPGTQLELSKRNLTLVTQTLEKNHKRSQI